MKKDRFVAFFDAIMAIIMTIVVLEFVIPEGTSWADLNTLGFQLLVYALSFFWLGTMWINLHSTWNHVETVSRPVLFVNLFTLFFSSLIPFFTVYVGRHITEKIPQLLYGIDVMLIILCNQISAELLAKHNEAVHKRIGMLRKAVSVDECIKLFGIVVGVTVFPPAVMIATFFSMIFLLAAFGYRRKIKERGAAR